MEKVEPTASFSFRKLKCQDTWPGKNGAFSLYKSVPNSWNSSQVNINFTHISWILSLNIRLLNDIHTCADLLISELYLLCLVAKYMLHYISLRDVLKSQENHLVRFKVIGYIRTNSECRFAHRTKTVELQRYHWFIDSSDPCCPPKQRNPDNLPDPKFSFKVGG